MEDPYTIVLTTYALTLLRSPSASAALRKMNAIAITQGKDATAVTSVLGYFHLALGRCLWIVPERCDSIALAVGPVTIQLTFQLKQKETHRENLCGY